MNPTFIIVSILLVAAAANFNNVSSRRTFELSPPSRNGGKKRIWLPEMPKPNQTASTTINTGNLQPSSTPGNITIGNIDSNGVNLGSSNGPLRISNGKVWNVPSLRTFELSPPSRNGVEKGIFLPKMPKPKQPASSTIITTGNLQQSSTSGNINIGNIDSNGVQIGSPSGPLRISNGNVWVRGKMVYTIPANKSFSMTAKHIVVDGVPVVDIVTGEVLVQNQKQNSTAKTSPPIEKSTSDGRIPYAKPNTVVEGANGQIKVDGVVVLPNDQYFKNYGWVEIYASDGKLFFNGNVILLDDPKANFKIGGLSVRTSGLYKFTVNFRNGGASFTA